MPQTVRVLKIGLRYHLTLSLSSFIFPLMPSCGTTKSPFSRDFPTSSCWVIIGILLGESMDHVTWNHRELLALLSWLLSDKLDHPWLMGSIFLPLNLLKWPHELKRKLKNRFQTRCSNPLLLLWNEKMIWTRQLISDSKFFWRKYPFQCV